jgi:radical S-adenosyl methionine domain-containing protein 2
MSLISVPLLLTLSIAFTTYFLYCSFSLPKPKPIKCPVSVNYHFSRQCNYSCGFCFHTATTSYKCNLADAKRGLALLADAGMRKVNFAGGEPFLHQAFLGALLDYCKQDLKLQTVSIVSNGSRIKESFLQQHAASIDILAISCDSFGEETNVAIGRGTGQQVSRLFDIATWCRELDIRFKVNTVVCRLNWTEDMNAQIARLQPFRWKVFQVLMVAGENDSDKTLKDVRKFQISDEEFESFCARHRGQGALVEEPNRLMKSSYLILDEYMRFLDREGREPSASILEVGVERALEGVFWDEEGFEERGGRFFEGLGGEGAGCGAGGGGKEIEF